MPNQSDVRDALKSLVLSIVFPAGTSQPSVTGNAVLVESGWPSSGGLTSQIAAGGSIVSIYLMPGASICTSRYNDASKPIQTAPTPVPTLAPTIAGQVVTIAGTPAVGQVVGIAAGHPGFVATYSYRILANDTDATIAAALAALIPGATVSGAALTIPGNVPIAVNVVADVVTLVRVTRMKDTFRVISWAPNQLDRDTLGGAVLAGLAQVPYLALPLGATARMIPQHSLSIDAGSGANTYRQDVNVTLEYDVTVSVTSPRVLFAVTNVNTVSNIAFGSLA